MEKKSDLEHIGVVVRRALGKNRGLRTVYQQYIRPVGEENHETDNSREGAGSIPGDERNALREL